MVASSVVLASGNHGKLSEFRALLASTGLDIVPQSALDVPEAEETGLTFVENAIIKARNAARYSGLPALADDSGLEVDALRGAPGIFSARFAGPDADDASNNRKLLDLLVGVPPAARTARYRCVLVYMRHAEDPSPLICQGSWEGIVMEAPRGSAGFGYDPLFWLPDHNCTAAELPATDKNRLSHRGQAMAELLVQLRQLQ